MAKVSLIVYTNKINIIGVRSLSAFLKYKGHDARIIYMLTPYHKYYGYFTDHLYEQVVSACIDSDLIGFSLTSNYHLEAVKGTKIISKLGKTIAWGGIHPTLFPEKCIKEVDIVFRGESEEAILELVEAISQKKDYSNIKNLWVRILDDRGGEIIKKNPLRQTIKNLDTIPFCDSDYESHLIADEDALKPVTHDLMKKYMTSGNTWDGRIDYYISTSRGCPFHCTYCCNNGLLSLYGGVQIRKRSAENVVREIEEVLKKYSFINFIFLTDEELFVQSKDFMKEFAELYKKRIGLPLKAEFAPSSFNEEKFKLLIDAGMVECHVGVQSGSDSTNKELYQRNIKIEKIYKILEIIKSYKDYLNKCYVHILVYNEMETEDSTRKTFEFVSNIGLFFDITFFPIVYFPGTHLFEKAKELKIIKEDDYLLYLANSGWDQLKGIGRADYYTVCFMFLYRIRKKFGLSERVSKIFYKIFTNRVISPYLKNRIAMSFLIKLYKLSFGANLISRVKKAG